MYDLFMTYWLIGIIFMVVNQLLSIAYRFSQGDKYIPEDNPAPVVIVIISNLFLTILYPLYVVLVILSTLDYSQKRKQMAYHMEEIRKKLEALDAKKKENQNHE
jgi:hypothetical protein